VAEHKSIFFSEKDAHGGNIDYSEAVSGSLRLVPEGGSRKALAQDFAAMCEDGLLGSDQPKFDAILDACAAMQDKVNRLA